MTRRIISVIPLLVLLVPALHIACATTAASCDLPDDPANCGCLGPCAEGEICVAGACQPPGSDSACGATQEACALGEHCDGARCVCDPEANKNEDFACGCPAVNCNDVADKEKCVDGECTCNPALHDTSDSSCGCPPVACDDGWSCETGVCVCDPLQHLSDSNKCACGAACAAGTICQAGVCVCASGTVACGDTCIPLGSHCCDPSGATCGADTSCVAVTNGYDCHPAGMTPCYDAGLYVGACAAGESCQISSSGLTCAPSGVELCFEVSSYVGFCDAGYTCAPGERCLPPGYSLCADDVTSCEAGKSCQIAAQGYACHPNGATPCYTNGFYIGFCEAGYACTQDGHCALPSWTICGDATTTCGPGTTCRRAAGGYGCQPDGTTACFNNGAYVRYCDAGYVCSPRGDTCVPPGWAICPGGETFCEAGKSCQLTASGYTCHPNNSTPCYAYNNGYYYGFCASSESCEQTVANVTSSGEFVCVPNNEVRCYRNGVYDHHCYNGWACTDTGCTQ